MKTQDLASSKGWILVFWRVYQQNFFFSIFLSLHCYSSVLNKCVGWNKHVGGKISQKLVNVLFLINMLVGNYGMKLMPIRSKFLIWEYILTFYWVIIIISRRNRPIKLVKKQFFCSFFMLIRLNKHVGRNIFWKLINMLFLIRACWMENFLKNK